ncbi:unnamed protein product [Scytosiphon promiscuus]
MLVEPHRKTRITVVPHHSPGEEASTSRRYYWLLTRADESGEPLEGEEALVDGRGGRFATITLTEAGARYALLVQHVRADDSVIAESRVTIACKYVRREVRELTTSDRVAFFSAMREFYTVPLEEGRAKYGEGFYNAKHVAACPERRTDYCFHRGMHFLNAHASFDLWVEQNLQKIDPRVSLAQWDFMLDAAHLGTRWTSSEIFGPEMFGSALGSPENGYQISDGWFANITSVYDPGGDLLSADSDGAVTTNHNPYGFVDSSFNYQALPGVIRTSSYCGLEGVSEFTQCEVFVDCFESSSSLYDWATCMEHSVHASMHGMIGGGYDCNTNMADFQEDNPQFSPELLTFALQFLLANKWPSNSLMADYNDCDEECEVGQTDACGCTCNTDPFEWTDDEVYEFMTPVLTSLEGRAHGDEFVHIDPAAEHTLGFMQDGERLDDDSTMLLLRQMMVIGCEPGKVGAMSTGASPMDPIFWVIHTGFEKAQHILQLSPGYRDSYDFEWVVADCGEGVSGGELDDTFPFTEVMLGLGDGTELLTNANILELLYPSNPQLPYIYEGFGKWGTCTDWDACPECGDGGVKR